MIASPIVATATPIKLQKQEPWPLSIDDLSLSRATCAGHLTVVDNLHRFGADVLDLPITYDTLLSWAYLYGDIALIESMNTESLNSAPQVIQDAINATEGPSP